VNMQPRQQELTFDDLFTKDGVPLDFHAAVQYQVTDSVKLVTDFGADDSKDGMGFFKRNLEQSFRMLVRDAVKKHGLNEMAINVSAAAAVDEEVTKGLKQLIADTRVPIRLIGVTLGRANPPDAIKHQRIATAEQEQRIQTEQQGKLAEDQRKAREESRAAADAAYNNKMNLTPDQYLRLETIKMQDRVCAAGHCTFFFGGVPTLTQPVR
jgi:regulator of protease activity HflC (stomatin/prohibitin superfamily)